MQRTAKAHRTRILRKVSCLYPIYKSIRYALDAIITSVHRDNTVSIAFKTLLSLNKERQIRTIAKLMMQTASS